MTDHTLLDVLFLDRHRILDLDHRVFYRHIVQDEIRGFETYQIFQKNVIGSLHSHESSQENESEQQHHCDNLFCHESHDVWILLRMTCQAPWDLDDDVQSTRLPTFLNFGLNENALQVVSRDHDVETCSQNSLESFEDLVFPMIVYAR